MVLQILAQTHIHNHTHFSNDVSISQILEDILKEIVLVRVKWVFIKW